MKMEKSHNRQHKTTKDHKETTMSNYMPIKWITWKKWTNS